MWLGTGKHFLAFPVHAGQIINYVGFVPADEEMERKCWSAPGDPEVLRREFAGWDPRIQSLLKEVQMTFRWALYDREPLPTWTKGRLSLLGDAAHPMLPHLGQGANQSIEDGMALATILARSDRKTAPRSPPRLRAAAPRARGAGPAWRTRERIALQLRLFRPRRPGRRDHRPRGVPQAALRPRRHPGGASRGGNPDMIAFPAATAIARR